MLRPLMLMTVAVQPPEKAVPSIKPPRMDAPSLHELVQMEDHLTQASVNDQMAFAIRQHNSRAQFVPSTAKAIVEVKMVLPLCV